MFRYFMSSVLIINLILTVNVCPSVASLVDNAIDSRPSDNSFEGIYDIENSDKQKS